MKGTMRSLILVLAGLVLAMTGAKVASATPMTFEITSYNTQGVAGNYNGNPATEYGGALTVTLNGDTLTNVYCVAPFTQIYANTWYNQTTVNTAGTIIGEPNNPITNAGEITWLMVNEAASATTLDQQSALQGAIWHLEGLPPPTGWTVDVATNATYYSDYENYLGLASASGHTDPVNDLLWINPSQYGTDHEQGFVSVIPTNASEYGLAAVPEPSSLTLFGLGAVALLRKMRKRRGNVE